MLRCIKQKKQGGIRCGSLSSMINMEIFQQFIKLLGIGTQHLE